MSGEREREESRLTPKILGPGTREVESPCTDTGEAAGGHARDSREFDLRPVSLGGAVRETPSRDVEKAVNAQV